MKLGCSEENGKLPSNFSKLSIDYSPITESYIIIRPKMFWKIFFNALIGRSTKLK